MRKVRRVFWIVLAGWLALFVMTGSTPQVSIFCFFAAVFWWFFGGIFSRMIVAMTIDRIRCPGCQLEIPAVNQWSIGSFQDHKERHFAMAKNPVDGTRIGHFPCPQCDTTILL
jgi:hypothetical protein